MKRWYGLEENERCNSQYRILEAEGSEKRRDLIFVNVIFVRAVIYGQGCILLQIQKLQISPPKNPLGGEVLD